MGLLDDLKKQAELVKTQQMSQENLRDERVALVEAKMRQSFQYVSDLLKQLAVIKPVNPMVFAVPGIGDLRELAFTDSFIDYRRKKINDKDQIDTISFYLKWSSPGNVVVERDMPAAVQKVRDALFGFNLKFVEEETRNARGVVANTRFTVQAVIVTDVVIRADHERGNLQLDAKNLLRLGADQFVVPAADVTEPMLEDFAKTLIGQPSAFRKFRAMPGAGLRPA